MEDKAAKVIDSIHQKLTERSAKILQGVHLPPTSIEVEDSLLVISFEVEAKICTLSAEVFIAMDGVITVACYIGSRRQDYRLLGPSVAAEAINNFFDRNKDM